MVLEETQAMMIDTTTTSADGYVLEGQSYNGNGLVGSLFGDGFPIKGIDLKKVVLVIKYRISKAIIIATNCNLLNGL